MSHKAACAEVPQFDRLRYFYGQMLHARDFQAEQAYFREKMKLHNRCLHGAGVVCGMGVTPVPPETSCTSEADRRRLDLAAKLKAVQYKAAQATTDEARKALQAEAEALQRELDKLPPACDPPAPRPEVQIDCGLALDCQGNELVVRAPLRVDLWASLSQAERDRVAGGAAATVYLALCHVECPVDPVRPVVPDGCGTMPDCTFGRLRDGVKVVVTLDADRWKERHCDTCCEPCEECCLLLARVEGIAASAPVQPGQVHPEVRREVPVPHQATRIVGINWAHGGVYSPEQAMVLLASEASTGGLRVDFSAPVRAETVADGVVDAWVVEGGAGRSAAIYSIQGKLEVGAPPTSLTFRDTTGESLNEGDRVIVTVRCAFLLDHCCRPVDGAHVGGRVPLLPGSPPFTSAPTPQSCLVPPRGSGPWTSGWSGAATFESWFWIRKVHP